MQHKSAYQVSASHVSMVANASHYGMRARRRQHSASRISLDYSRCETPSAAYDERACHNGWYHKMQRIELVKCEVDLER